MDRQQNNNDLNDWLFHGYSYVIHMRRNDKIYLRCTYYQTRFCRGRGKIIGRNFVATCMHNHAPIADAFIIRHFKRSLRRACITQFRSPRSIYNLLSALNPEAALLVPWERIRANMERWQRYRRFPNVTSLLELRQVLDEPRYRQLMVNETGETEMQLLRSNDRNEVVGALFTNREFFSRIIVNHGPIFIAVNRLNVPMNLNTIQNLTILIPHLNHSFSIGWCLIENNDSDTYRIVIQRMIQELGENFIPDKVFFNFNNEIFTHLREAFPAETIVKGSFSSHCHIILEQAELMNIPFNRPNLIILRKLISLSLLPPTKIYEAFISLRSAIPAHMIHLEQIFQYYCNHWIINVGPSNYSFYNDTEALFNCEDAHWEMMESMLHHHNQQIWSYIEVFYKIFERSEKVLNRLLGQQRVPIYSIPRVRYVINRTNIIRLWNLIGNNEINLSHFLGACAGLLDTFINDIIFRGIIPDVNFELVRYNHDLNRIIPEFEVEPVDILAELHVNGAQRRLGPENEMARRNRLIQEGKFVTDDGKCIICADNMVQIEFLPCRHCVICEICIAQLRRVAAENGERMACPMCRMIPMEVRRVE